MAGSRTRRRRCPASVLQVLAAFSAAVGRDLPYRVMARRPGDVPTSYADPHLAEIELDWRADRTLDQMCAYGVLHVAGHAEVFSEFPWRSGFLLDPRHPESEAGWLRADEVVAWKRAPPLVVLWDVAPQGAAPFRVRELHRVGRTRCCCVRFAGFHRRLGISPNPAGGSSVVGHNGSKRARPSSGQHFRFVSRPPTHRSSSASDSRYVKPGGAGVGRRSYRSR